MMRRIITVGLGVLTGWSVRAVAFHVGLETQAATGLMVLLLLHLFLLLAIATNLFSGGGSA
jgi:hypothetical protein